MRLASFQGHPSVNVSIWTSRRVAAATALATVLGNIVKFQVQKNDPPLARIRRTISGPALVKSSLRF